jgi:hypothetical protein
VYGISVKDYVTINNDCKSNLGIYAHKENVRTGIKVIDYRYQLAELEGHSRDNPEHRVLEYL